MKSSIISNEKRCYVCGKQTDLHYHHIIFGKNRNKADEDLLTVYLCREHHEGTNGVHGKNGHDLDLRLKQYAEQKWIEHYNKTIDDFISRYSRNYLD